MIHSGGLQPEPLVDVVPDYGAYEPLAVERVAARLAAYPEVAARLGGRPEDWQVREVGDGNLNFVYIVEGPAGSVCAKQALPFVRLVGESWPLPLSRSFFEHAALSRQARLAGTVPQILRFDGPQALIVMENLGTHVIWRKALTARERHETAAPILGRFMAETLFRTSDLNLSAAEKKREAALFAGNTALAKITEDLVFTDPYRVHPLNRWTSPELDGTAAKVRGDAEWKLAIQELKWQFLCSAEALVHGDLHTGSVMVSKAGDAEDVRVIDPEFAFYGPMGFDVGALLANLFLSYFAQDGHGPGAEAMKAWLLVQGTRVWDAFAARFSELWRTERRGDAYPASLFEEQGQADASEAALEAFLARLQVDALGFAGAKMARRILGLAHVSDLETIEPPALRAACETRALALARQLVVERRAIATVSAACRRAAILSGADA
ncbi:S-methyl-5-thioribose kinase [Antarcticirhabdus aurantiaca]|uniref:S-methyl-5-thioribose kinase n=1 Tax=Antarcticirhabdus aurantiaca TaxID=2606717 RepID=A0ACD4NH38_9HYPH|nr:S-methyl-5-thioribose kinase [Antarcticirhabdus aurantiaca]WAJ26122.1 S-methyl-5-thioribose kinase [Jeongeuplla avenae]